MNVRLFYKNPITGKWDFLYTHYALCYVKVSLNKENLFKNQFGQFFYYCKNCSHRERNEPRIYLKKKRRPKK